MAYVIGFTNKYYTLWEYSEEDIILKNIYGQVKKVGIKGIYKYIKNISFNKEIVIKKYPGIEIQPNLNGISRSFEEKKYDPNIIPFGKYEGETIDWVAKNDFDYLIWIKESSFLKEKERKEILNHPLIIGYMNKEKKIAEDKNNHKQYLIHLLSTTCQEIKFIENPRNFDDYRYVNFEFKNIKFTLELNKNQFKLVNCLYPYYIVKIKDKFKRVKNKSFTLQLSYNQDDDVFTLGKGGLL